MTGPPGGETRRGAPRSGAPLASSTGSAATDTARVPNGGDRSTARSTHLEVRVRWLREGLDERVRTFTNGRHALDLRSKLLGEHPDADRGAPPVVYVVVETRQVTTTGWAVMADESLAGVAAIGRP